MDLFGAIFTQGSNRLSCFRAYCAESRRETPSARASTTTNFCVSRGALAELREDERYAVDAALLEAEMKHLRCELHELDKVGAINKRRQRRIRCGVLTKCLGGNEAVAKLVLSNLYVRGELAPRVAPGPYTMTQPFLDPESGVRWLWVPHTNSSRSAGVGGSGSRPTGGSPSGMRKTNRIFSWSRRHCARGGAGTWTALARGGAMKRRGGGSGSGTVRRSPEGVAGPWPIEGAGRWFYNIILG